MKDKFRLKISKEPKDERDLRLRAEKLMRKLDAHPEQFEKDEELRDQVFGYIVLGPALVKAWRIGWIATVEGATSTYRESHDEEGT